MSTYNMAHRQRLVADQILDRIAHDPAFHRQLLDNTAQALRSAGFAQGLETAEVAGYAAINVCGKLTCGYKSCGKTCLKTCSPGNTCAITDTCASSAKQ